MNHKICKRAVFTNLSQFLLLWTKMFIILSLCIAAVVTVFVGLIFAAEYSPVLGLICLIALASGIFAFTKAWMEDFWL